jgi:hypothetical protein
MCSILCAIQRSSPLCDPARFGPNEISRVRLPKQDFAKQDFAKQDFAKQDFAEQDFGILERGSLLGGSASGLKYSARYMLRRNIIPPNYKF